MLSIVLIVLLASLVLALLWYNIKIYKQVQLFSNTNQKINNLNVIQDFMEAMGEDIPADKKIEKINEVLIQRYDIKYSTIVVFNGAEYEIKATNVDEKHWEVLKNLHMDEMFKESVETATPKYVTVDNENEKLPYQVVELARAKSAMFFPLYNDNIYIGYWIIESGEIHAFDTIDTTVLSVVKDDIINLLKTVSYQTTLENIYRIDKFTGLYSAEYLYGIAKKSIDKYTLSTVCMLKITNLEEINEQLDRKVGNKTVIEISNLIKQNLSSDYVFVRYMGPKFAIVFSGVETDGVVQFLKDLKKNIERLKMSKGGNIEQEDKTTKKKNSKKQRAISPQVNFVISTYYKGTAIEAVTKKLEEYLDSTDSKENDINYI